MGAIQKLNSLRQSNGLPPSHYHNHRGPPNSSVRTRDNLERDNNSISRASISRGSNPNTRFSTT